MEIGDTVQHKRIDKRQGVIISICDHWNGEKNALIGVDFGKNIVTPLHKRNLKLVK